MKSNGVVSNGGPHSNAVDGNHGDDTRESFELLVAKEEEALPVATGYGERVTAYSWVVLVILSFVNLLNYADRYTIAGAN